ncbi:Solute carrier family 10 member 6 [Holothuria leucospilota]|uniref:Solute carrier family 10 member 6 n=1 Tax=Holothuria leucospilota TaxID=206669 RepID=A0A9Q1C075_HOLLE|nr:Solute carrier family 10 member 6 [Holothuria leucospilota]
MYEVTESTTPTAIAKSPYPVKTSEWDLHDIYQLEELTQLITHICNGISMFGVGCVISVKDFQRKETRLPKAVSIGLFLQTLIQPLTGFLLAMLLQMSKYDALAMVVIASAPSAPYASVLSYWGDGNVALSVCIATLSTALSIGMMPMWFFLYSSVWSRQHFIVAYPLDIAQYLLLIIVPVGFGMATKWCMPKVSKYIARVCSIMFLSSVVICSLLYLIFHTDHFRAGWHLYLSALLLPFIGFFLGFLMAFVLRLPYEVCIAISLAVGSVNGPLAITVALHSFEGATKVVQVVLQLPAIYALFAPVEGIVWSLMYKMVDEVFSKAHPALCGTGSV